MQWPDALGLGLFSATGTQLALAQDLPGIVAVLMGVITGVFGGVMRDVLCNEIPLVFHDHCPYALCAFVGGWAFLGANALGAEPLMAFAIGGGVATGLRLLALAWDWRIPAWPREDES